MKTTLPHCNELYLRDFNLNDVVRLTANEFTIILDKQVRKVLYVSGTPSELKKDTFVGN